MPRPPRQCQRCDTPLGPGSPFVVVEASQVGGPMPGARRWLCCLECGQAVTAWLIAGPALEPAESNP